MERLRIHLFKFEPLFCKIYSILLTFRCTQYQMQVLGNIWGYIVSLNRGISFHAEKYLRSLHAFPIKNISEIYSQVQYYCIVPPFTSNACTLFTAYTQCFNTYSAICSDFYYVYQANCLLKFVDRLILPRYYSWTKHISLLDWFLCYLMILFQLHKSAMANWRHAGRIRPAACFTPAPAKSQVYFQKSSQL